MELNDKFKDVPLKHTQVRHYKISSMGCCQILCFALRQCKVSDICFGFRIIQKKFIRVAEEKKKYSYQKNLKLAFLWVIFHG